MSTFPGHDPSSLDHSTASSSYPLDILISKPSINRNTSEQDYAAQNSPSGSLDTQRSHILEAQEEGLLTGRSSFMKTRVGTTSSAVIVLRVVLEWLKGPRAPRPYEIRPVLPDFQSLPTAALNKFFPKDQHKLWLLLCLDLAWLIVFVGILIHSIDGCQVPGYQSSVRLSCISRLWRSSTLCGVDASNCRPFDKVKFAFRCPAGCRDTIIASPETIGDEEYNYQTIVVGGSSTAVDSSLPVYRGDSFICGAAVHAGIISNHRGGSGVVSLIGEHSDFPAVDANGVSSLNFTPSFPLSFTLEQDSSENDSRCEDPRWKLLGTTFIFTIAISIFTTSQRMFFGSTFVCIYFCVALASDPPDFEDYMHVVSWAFRGFLPAAFVGLAIYHFCVRRSLNGLNAPFEKTILWLGGCWVGALSNFTFEKLPIQRLTLHDLRQPGAMLTLIIITLVVLFIAVFQAWAFRLEGRLLKYLTVYTCFGLILLVLAAVPFISLRIHHYILALLLLPGTALQTRPSLFYQGILVGLFINGVARWGFDSILQTPRDLYGDDFNTAVPSIPTPIIDSGSSSITFSWVDFQSAYDGISVLVNDVERFRGSEDRGNQSFTWTRYKETELEYFRFAYVKNGIFDRSSIGKFTKPGTWELDGTWIPPTESASAG